MAEHAKDAAIVGIKIDLLVHIATLSRKSEHNMLQ
jgi:hypothetical protein